MSTPARATKRAVPPGIRPRSILLLVLLSLLVGVALVGCSAKTPNSGGITAELPEAGAGGGAAPAEAEASTEPEEPRGSAESGGMASGGTVDPAVPAARAPVYDSPRALWIVRHDLADRKRLTDAIEWAAEAGFTDLLVQVMGRGDAYYHSAFVPRAEELTDLARDPLAEAVALARARGLRLHVWINVALVWSSPKPPRAATHVANAHRDWFVWITTKGKAPRNSLDLKKRELNALELEGHFLNLGHPEVGVYLEDVVREILRQYAVDGIHFDYARLPRSVKSLDPLSRAEFKAQHGVDPVRLGAPRAAGDTLAAAWYRFHEERVTRLMEHLAAAARETLPGILVSAAVYPDPVLARRERGQAWDRWLDEGTIDVAAPMCYAADTRIARSDLRVARAATSGRLWAGLGLYNKPLDEALAGTALARELGYEGVALFSHTAAREQGPRAGTAIATALSVFAGAGAGP